MRGKCRGEKMKVILFCLFLNYYLLIFTPASAHHPGTTKPFPPAAEKNPSRNTVMCWLWMMTTNTPLLGPYFTLLLLSHQLIQLQLQSLLQIFLFGLLTITVLCRKTLKQRDFGINIHIFCLPWRALEEAVSLHGAETSLWHCKQIVHLATSAYLISTTRIILVYLKIDSCESCWVSGSKRIC